VLVVNIEISRAYDQIDMLYLFISWQSHCWSGLDAIWWLQCSYFPL